MSNANLVLATRKNFDEDGYLRANPDVAIAVEQKKFSSGREHFDQYGSREGRSIYIPVASNWKSTLSGLMGFPVVASRKEKIFSFIDSSLKGLEIGPSHRPAAPKREGFNVKILDHLSAEGLREKYRSSGLDIAAIEEVDFVWSGQPLAELVGDERFNWIIAAHLIEHVPDFIGFLRECEKMLENAGVLSLVVPDKRYCFDHFREVSSLAQVIDAHVEKRQTHSSGSVAEFYLNACKKNGVIAWDPAHQGNYEFCHGSNDAKEMMARASTGEYLDIHAWCFTPSSFRLLMQDLFTLGLIQLREVGFFPTEGHEFFIALAKSDNHVVADRMDFLREREIEVDK